MKYETEYFGIIFSYFPALPEAGKYGNIIFSIFPYFPASGRTGKYRPETRNPIFLYFNIFIFSSLPGGWKIWKYNIFHISICFKLISPPLEAVSLSTAATKYFVVQFCARKLIKTKHVQ